MNELQVLENGIATVKTMPFRDSHLLPVALDRPLAANTESCQNSSCIRNPPHPFFHLYLVLDWICECLILTSVNIFSLNWEVDSRLVTIGEQNVVHSHHCSYGCSHWCCHVSGITVCVLSILSLPSPGSGASWQVSCSDPSASYCNTDNRVDIFTVDWWLSFCSILGGFALRRFTI